MAREKVLEFKGIDLRSFEYLINRFKDFSLPSRFSYLFLCIFHDNIYIILLNNFFRLIPIEKKNKKLFKKYERYFFSGGKNDDRGGTNICDMLVTFSRVLHHNVVFSGGYE